jgi:hypothetical protein
MDLKDEHGGTLDWGNGGKTSALMGLTMKVAKIETFVRNLEKDLAGVNPDNSKERLVKNESRLDVIEGRLSKIEESIAALDDLKSVSKWLNPKALGSILALLMGGSVAGNIGLSSLQDDTEDDKIEQKIETQDERLDKLLKMFENRDEGQAR